ncbi:MAG: SPFH domain-containing protein [Chloroflexota bacterium]|nr:SPFH domain-containing protein [Chloroflexota bacterium]
MRMKLVSENSKRLLVLLLLALLVLLVGGIVELGHRQINLAERLGLAEFGGELPAILVLVNILISTIILAIQLLPAALLNSLPALVALAVIPWLASRFIHTLHDTKNLKEAHDFLQGNVFGMGALAPLLIVKEGHIAVGKGVLCDRIGGRAVMIVYNDSAVVLEKGGRLTRVVGGPYFGFLESFERIWEVVDLRHQRWVLTDDAMTKDGIPIACEADITFKIDDRFIDEHGNAQTKPPSEAKTELPTDTAIEKALKKAGGGIGNPLPYTKEAVFKAATSLWVRIRQPDHKEQLRKWTGRVVIGEVEGTLRSILARYRLDWLMQPPQSEHEHPREEIRALLEQKLQKALSVGNKLGARVLQVNLGQIDVKNENISTQWVKAWQAGWDQKAMEIKAEGEAEAARLGVAQIQAQAEMVLTLTEAIRPLVTSREEIPSYLLAMQFIETLRWMAYDPFKRAFLPPETLRMLDELEKILKRNETSAPPDESSQRLGRLLIEGREIKI